MSAEPGTRILKHVRAIAVLPLMAAVIIPAALLYWTHSVRMGWSFPVPWHLVPTLAGITAIGLGTILFLATVVLFERTGKGTLAPWDPPKRLVVRGVYRHMRNPMITGVACIVIGEAILFGSVPLLCWFVLFVGANAVYMPLIEEPALARRFQDDYLEYKKNVPRWIPRWTPWPSPWSHEDPLDH